jgi:hypothetical protein
VSEIGLKACPFCGGSAFIVQEGTHAQCLTPGCCVGPVCGLDSWNARAPQWQPIESAPKDGTRLMLWDSRNGGYAVTGAWVAGSAEDHETITHWQPLPAAPEMEG